MFKRKFVILTTLLIFLPITNNLKASILSDAEAWAKIRGEATLEAFAEQDTVKRFAKIDALILENFDIPAIGRFVVGRYWRLMNPQVQDYFLRVFQRYSLANYKSIPFTLSKEAHISSIKAMQTEEDVDETITINAVVITKVQEDVPDGTLSLDLRLKKADDGFKIFDIKIAEVSSLLVYRDRFTQMIRDRNNDLLWFIEDLDIMAEDMEDIILRSCPQCAF